MPESTSKGIQYPVPTDLIKSAGVDSKLANDLKTLALSTDAAIGVQVGKTFVEAISAATVKDSETLHTATTISEELVADLGAETRARLALLESAAGFPGEPLEFTDTVVANLIQGDTETRENTQQIVNSTLYPAVPELHYWVSPTGDDTNDGLDPERPKRTGQAVVDATGASFFGYGVEVVINFAPGTYPTQIRFEKSDGVSRKYRLRGPIVATPQVPTVVFARGTGSGDSAVLVRDPNLSLTVESIKLSGYANSQSAGGIVAAGCDLHLNNVHAENCYWGVTMVKGSISAVGGVFENNGYLASGGSSAGAGIRSLMLTRHAIGVQNGSIADGPIFRNNYYGFLAQESSTGHVDYSTFTGNEFGLVAQVSSRANAIGSVFESNTVGVMAQNSSNVLLSSETAFPTDPAKANAANVWRGSSATVALSTHDAYIDGINIQRASELRRVYTHPQTELIDNESARFILERILTAGWWDNAASTITPPRKLILRAAGEIMGTGSTKQIRPILGATAHDAFISHAVPADQTGGFQLETGFTFKAPGQQTVVSTLTISGHPPQVATKAGLSPTFGAQQLRLSGSARTAQIRFDSIEIYVEG